MLNYFAKFSKLFNVNMKLNFNLVIESYAVKKSFWVHMLGAKRACRACSSMYRVFQLILTDFEDLGGQLRTTFRL